MHKTTPHTTLLALHQPVDMAMRPFYEPIGLECTTESIVTVNRQDLLALAAPGSDPHAAMIAFGDVPAGSALLIAEPGLASSILAGMWRSDRNRGAQLTNVESEIVRQHLADIVNSWSRAWRSEGIELIPRLTLAGTLSALPANLPDGEWYVARTVALDANDQPVGVLLFCYPAHLIPTLQRERERIRWRSRISGGLDGKDAERLRTKLAGPLKHVVMPVRATMTMDLPIGIINSLERGDVIGLDAAVGGAVEMQLIDRRIIGSLMRCGSRLAIAVRDVPAPASAGSDTDAAPAAHSETDLLTTPQYAS